MNIKWFFVALAAAALPSFATAQVNPALAEITEATEQARSIIQTERKMIVSQGLELTPAQSNAFWPVYDKYMAEMKEIGNRRVKVITDFAANYDSITDETARQLIADSLKYQEQMVDLRKNYLSKFRKALPETKVLRFYQLENKLDAITNFALARQIPLAPAQGTAKPMSAP
jgi:type IV secretory pathway VirB4 component